MEELSCLVENPISIICFIDFIVKVNKRV